MATPQRSRYRDAVARLQAKEVHMDTFDIAFFQQIGSIGTDGLGSCSVALIVSPHAAILGHIPPRPPHADIHDPHAGNNHVRLFMDRLTQFYLEYQSYFPKSPHSWAICAVFGNSIALPDQQNIIETKLRAVGLDVDTKTYTVPTMSDNLNRGSVFVDTRGSAIQVYVEDTVVKVIPKASSPAASQTQQSASGWTWSPQYKRYYRQIGTAGAVEWAPLSQ